MKVEIVSAEEEIYSGTAEMVFAPSVEGEIGVAPGHAPLLTLLGPGEVRVKISNEEEASFYVSGGMIEVQLKLVTILSDTASEQKTLMRLQCKRLEMQRRSCLKLEVLVWITQKREHS